MRPILSRRVLPSCSLVEEECSYKKLTWVIKDFCSIQSKKYYSDKFVVSGCRWRLLAFPKGNGVEWLSLYLEVAGESLPDGWKRHAAFNCRIVNHISERFSQVKGTQHWFDATTACDWGFISMIPLNVLHDQTAGFLVNGELKIVAEVNVLEVIGKLDVPDESEEATKSLDQLEDDDFPEVSNFEEASSAKEFVDVSSFQVLPSQVESLSRIFERHPDIASAFRPKNQHLRSAYMSVLLSLIETLCQSTQELSKDDLKDAYAILAYLTDSGLNLDWLEEKLKEMSEKKQKQESGERRVQEIEEELKDLNEKCLNLEAQLEKEKGDVSMARAPLSFDDVV